MKELVGIHGLLRLRTLADELARLTNEYLEKGYTSDEITETISEMFLRQLRVRLTPKAIRQMPRGGFNQPVLDVDTAVELFCLDFSSAFMATAGKRLAKRHKA